MSVITPPKPASSPAVPLHIDVFVEAHTREVTPDPVYIESSEQTVRWWTDAEEIRIEPKKDTPPITGAIFRRGWRYCEIARIPTGNFGRHRYSVILTMEGGKEVSIDPEIIVKY